MTERLPIAARPPVGFVVEGHGEFQAYPSLVARMIGASAHIPRVLAQGYGGVVQHLHEHLDDLVRTDHPYSVIITVDLREIVDNGLFGTCAALLVSLQEEIEEWIRTRSHVAAFDPVPDRIVPVIQIPAFESWWLADPVGLASVGLFDVALDDCGWDNTDEAVRNPAKWLKEAAKAGCRPKSPATAERVISSLNPEEMSARSRSFRKFRKEVQNSYNSWLAAMQI